MTALLAISNGPGTAGAVINAAGISPQQGLGTITITVHDCAGNPVANAVIQLESLSRSQWTYTNPNGVAALSAPAGAYTLQGGYGTFLFSQTINLSAGSATATAALGAGCLSFSYNSSTQTPYPTPIRPIRNH